jgi:hypothetical protein
MPRTLAFRRIRSLAFLAAVLILLFSRNAHALKDCETAMPDCPPCQGTSCNNLTGNWNSCTAISSLNGHFCDDGNACTTGDTCQAGVCRGAAPTNCPAPDPVCQTAGTICSAGTHCPTPLNRTDGTPCTYNSFTSNSTCQTGSCSAGTFCANATASTCVPNRCQSSPTCDAAANACKYQNNCTASIVVSKQNQSGTAFTSPGAVITTSPATDTIAAATSSSSIAVIPGTYAVSTSSPGPGFITYYSLNSASFVPGNSVSVTVAAGAAPTVIFRYQAIAKLAVTVNPPAGGPVTACSSTSVSVTALDAGGNQVTGYIGSVQLSGGGAGATFPASHSFTTGDAGSFTFTGVVLHTTGTPTITASDGTISTASALLTVNPGAAASFAVAPSPSSVTADAAFNVTVNALDSCGNIATGYSGTVSLSAPTDGQGVIPASQTLISGQRTFTGMKLRTAGSRQVTAKDTANTAITGAATVTVAPGPAAVLSLGSFPTSGTACAAQSLAVTVQDAFGNAPNSAYTGTLTVSSADGAGSYPGAHAFTAADHNTFTFSGITLRTASTNAWQVKVQDAAGALTASKSITINATASVGGFSLVFVPSLTACASASAVVTAYDTCSNSNVAANYVGMVAFTSSDPAAVLPANYAFTVADHGHHTFNGVTLNTAGSMTIKAQDTAVPGLTRTVNVTVQPGPPAAMVLSGIINDTPVGNDLIPVVQITDACPAGTIGNLVPTYSGTVAFTVSDPLAAVPAPYTFSASDSGMHVYNAGSAGGPLTLWTPGVQTISVSGVDDPSFSSELTFFNVDYKGGCRAPPTGVSGMAPDGTAPNLPSCEWYVCFNHAWEIDPLPQGSACPHPDMFVDPQCNASNYICDGTGACTGVPVSDDAQCDDGSLCTSGKRCVSGVCTPRTSVACSASDQCHTIGACVPSTGVCTNPLQINGTICNDGDDACTSTDICTAGACGGTLSCSPVLNGVANNSAGTLTFSWTAPAAVILRYSLIENGTTEVFSGSSTTFSSTLSGKSDGDYTYQVKGWNAAGAGPLSNPVILHVLNTPGVPGSISAPSKAGPSYALSWSAASGAVDRYELEETLTGQPPTLLTLHGALAEAFISGKFAGTWTYRVRACNATGCSAYTVPVGVQVISGLPAVDDTPSASSGAPALVSNLGSVPGTASVSGGNASYHVPIEVPPGRAGMQPDLALTYGSRGGNGVAGVGWSLSGSGAVSRCPATPAQDGARRVILHDDKDKLCLNGQRLIVDPSGPAYGALNSVYFTETDPYDRVTLKGAGIAAGVSSFEVQHKDGAISQYEMVGDNDTWYLKRVYDRQNNCIQYNYAILSTPQGLPVPVPGFEVQLTSIGYTGTGTPAGGACTGTTRTVAFRYGLRPDIRTTYQYGYAKLMKQRLTGVDTSVGSVAVRSYNLNYHLSAVTQRSLLDAVTVCAGGTCLPPISFDYQEPHVDAPVSQATIPFSDVQYPNPFGASADTNWEIVPVADLDGDGTRDLVFQSNSSRLLALSSCPGVLDVSATGQVDFGAPGNFVAAANVIGATDVDHDGRADLISTLDNILAVGTIDCAGNVNYGNTRMTLPPPAAGQTMAAGLMDFDGDGRLDVSYGFGNLSDWKIILDRTPVDSVSSPADLFSVRDPSTYSMPSAADLPGTTQNPKFQDFNGDGMMDQWYDLAASLNDSVQVAFFTHTDAPVPVYSWDIRAAQTMGVAANGQVFTGAFGGVDTRRWIDVNGDGLPDVWDPATQSIWINRGGAVGSQLFMRVTYTWDQPSPPPRLDAALTVDVDSDGVDELLVPTTRVDKLHGGRFCWINILKSIDPDGDKLAFCGEEFDTAPASTADYRKADRSVFNWVAYRFVEQIDGTYKLIKTPIDLTAPIHRDGTALDFSDMDGNGSPDLIYSLFNSTVDTGQQYYDGLDPSLLGPHVAYNMSDPPDLMIRATQNIVPADSATPKAVTSAWSYRTLTQNGPVGECGAPGKNFYVSHPGNLTPGGYAFFASSMPAVTFFDTSNGLDGAGPGGSTNRTCYRYEDAMISEAGRGFQGFKVIHEEQRFAAATGEAALPGADCGGAACSANNLFKETDFLQVFPVTSRVQRQKTTTWDGIILSDTVFSWDVQFGPIAGTWVVNQGASDAKSNDTGGSLIGEVATVSRYDLPSGEPTQRCAITTGPVRAATDVIVCDVRNILSDTTGATWWLGKLNSRVTSTDFYPTTSPWPSVAAGQTGNYPATILSLPAMPAMPISAGYRQHTESNSWFGDSDALGSVRKLKSFSLTGPSARRHAVSQRSRPPIPTIRSAT